MSQLSMASALQCLTEPEQKTDEAVCPAGVQTGGIFFLILSSFSL